jgi:hypothetical protein
MLRAAWLLDTEAGANDEEEENEAGENDELEGEGLVDGVGRMNRLNVESGEHGVGGSRKPLIQQSGNELDPGQHVGT